MSEPSSGVPGEIADAQVEEPTTDEPDTVELEVDEEKLEAWDEVKGDYQVEPGGQPVANSMDQATSTAADSDVGRTDDAGHPDGPAEVDHTDEA
jgi:hypothetical protein